MSGAVNGSVWRKNADGSMDIHIETEDWFAGATVRILAADWTAILALGSGAKATVLPQLGFPPQTDDPDAV